MNHSCSRKALVIAVSKYLYWEALPIAKSAAECLAGELEKGGYIIDDRALLEGGTHSALREAVNKWLKEAPAAGTLLLYWTGHGHCDDGLYLIGHDTPVLNLTGLNAINAEDIGRAVAHSNAEKILVIIDTCYSGEGALDIAAAFARVMASRVRTPDHHKVVAVIASAHPLEKAREGVFCNALRSVMCDGPPDRLWSDESEFISSDYLAKALAIKLRHDDIYPQYKADGYGQDFIPNPRHQSGRVPEDVETRKWREDREHFYYASRGIEVEEIGWYFTGRTRLLRDLVSWLKTANNGVRIVTGLPGSGKSAVIGRLSTLSDLSYRAMAQREGILAEAADGTTPPEGIVDVAIHAKGKTVDDCARALARGLQIPLQTKQNLANLDLLVRAVAQLPHPVTVLIDALDEAASGHARLIADKLIVSIGGLPHARVLVGTRRNLDGACEAEDQRHAQLREVFGAGVIIDDLAAENDTTSDDIATYVRRRLAKSQRDAQAIDKVARRVAKKAGESFLYARVVSRTLQETSNLEDELPNDALDAFTHDLQQRFGPESERISSMLAALAWGAGKGLTRRIWPQVAQAISANAAHFTDDDVSKALSLAGWHIIETGEEGQAVYRLAHQAFADHYHNQARRDGIDAVDANRRITQALSQDIAGSAWLDADGYVWRHLAQHATFGKVLGALLRDPGFLAVANPTYLLPCLNSVTIDDDRRFVAIYERVAHKLPAIRPVERMAYIHLTANMEDWEIAPQLQPSVSGSWYSQWARVRPTAPHRIVGHHNEKVTTVALGDCSGLPVIVSAGADRTVRIWDASTGAIVGNPIEGHVDEVTAVALGYIAGQSVVVSSCRDETLRVWNMTNHKCLHVIASSSCDENIQDTAKQKSIIARWWDEFMRDLQKGRLERIPVLAVVLGDCAGQRVIVSGNDDGTVRRWSATSGAAIGKPLAGHEGAVNSVVLGDIDGQPVIVSGSNDGTVRRWSATSGAAIGKPLAGHEGAVNSVALGDIDGQPVIVSGGNDGTVRLWDATTSDAMGEPLIGHEGEVMAVALGNIDEQSVIISGGRDRTIRLWDKVKSAPIGEPLRGHHGAIKAVALGTIVGRPIIISGSWDETVRIWDVRACNPLRKVHENHDNRVMSLAFGCIAGRPVLVSGSDDRTVRIWNAATGTPEAVLWGHEGEVNAVAVGDIGDKPVIISGSSDWSIRVWDAQTGSLLLSPREGHNDVVTAVALGRIGGRPAIVSGSWDKTIRIWDPVTGASVMKPLKGHDGGVNAVALGDVADRAVIISGGWDRTVRIWDAATATQLGTPLEGHSALVRAVALGRINCRATIVSGSADKTVRVWDPAGIIRRPPLMGHDREITAVALADINGRAVIVSGSADKTVRIWDGVDHECLFTIDVEQIVLSVVLTSEGVLGLGTESGVILLKILPR